MGAIIRTPVETKEIKNRKERKNNRRKKEKNKTEDAEFYEIETNFSGSLELQKVQVEAKVMM